MVALIKHKCVTPDPTAHHGVSTVNLTLLGLLLVDEEALSPEYIAQCQEHSKTRHEKNETPGAVAVGGEHDVVLAAGGTCVAELVDTPDQRCFKKALNAELVDTPVP